MKPLHARCRACDDAFPVDALASARDGRCPRCSTPLSPGWDMLLVEECAAAETLSHALVRSLRRLTGLPGNLELRPDELFDNLTNEVPWHQSIDSEGELVASDIAALVAELDHGTVLTPQMAEPVRQLAARLARLATLLDANQEATRPGETDAGGVARAAAQQLGDAATGIEGGDDDQTALRRGLERAASVS